MDHIGFSWTTVVFGLLQFLFGLFLITRLLVDKFLGHKDGVVARGLSRRLPQAENDSAGPSEMEYLEHGDHVEKDTGKCSGKGIENKAFVGSSGVETPIFCEPGKLTNDGQESTSCDILESRVESESSSSAVSEPTINNADTQSTPPVDQTEDDTKTN
ncbi:uncharacterized protein LOC106159954 [Lingula anatina]|uniref:Uncharacterized protein LOC106159954 n=1 Tax=Lingula anatina TaxID=7574 RepID=A0A1S3I0T7_LINAN|nr:uncharacterized protein LOC106159954 [Lingula anatina]|eukprot:XP_013391873.1 uncharacterized protein LOC106159954 [Lingula anatina]